MGHIATQSETSPIVSVINIGGETSDLMAKLLRERKSARNFQERRHTDWNENYELYRNKVFTNRLTQRQTVNIPLMKETIKTLQSKIDDPPIIEWKELSGDQEKEIILQEMWNTAFQEQNFEGVDAQDKKTVLTYGRGFKKLNFVDKKVEIKALDIFDVVVDPLVDPLDIETARFIIHQNIFRSLRDILADDRYSEKGKKDLRIWMNTPEAMVVSSQNKEELERKNHRLESMGVDHAEFPLFAAGDVIVNLCEHYTLMWNTKAKKFERRVVVYANDQVELLDELLTDMVGVDFWPFVTWGEDVETVDFWNDGPGDLVRTPNKLINVWFSQMSENRTLKNFQMHWYDGQVEDYEPQTYEPGPGRMLPAPGPPGETIKAVEISGLEDAQTAIDWVIGVVERGTAATGIEKGTGEDKRTTLGEVEILVGKATERTVAMAKFYRRSWKELAMKWYRMTEANVKTQTTLVKVSRKGTLWPLRVFPSDWKSKEGFMAFVRSSSEQDSEKLKTVKTFEFLMSKFPNNTALRRIGQKRMIEVVDLTPEEMREVMDEEKKRIEEKEKLLEAREKVLNPEAQAAAQPGASAAAQGADQVLALQQEQDLQDQLDEFIDVSEVEDTETQRRLQEVIGS